MAHFLAFLRDEDRGDAIVEYALTFALFGIFCVIGILGYQKQAGEALVNTRARMTCNTIQLRATVSASVDSAGNITCN